jgi:hypothetical protein
MTWGQLKLDFFYSSGQLHEVVVVIISLQYIIQIFISLQPKALLQYLCISIRENLRL